MSAVVDARAMAGDLIELRRTLHREPEIGLRLPRTQERVLVALDGLPLEITTGDSCTSVTAVLRGARSDHSVLLRADMDALPVQEATGLDYTSTVDGVMHACGHDLHTAMLVGAAHLLSYRRDELAGDVVFMFQPGEEGWEGARAMIDEGVLDASGRRVAAAYGLHVFSTFSPAGVFQSRPGPMLAGSASLTVTVHGGGGHGSTPHLTRDPIIAAAEMISALQTMVTREFDVFDPVVLTVGVFQAGTRSNIIPESARFEATIRTFSASVKERIRASAVRLVRGLADAHDVEVDVDYADARPVTVNDKAEHDFAREVVRESLGERRYSAMANPVAGAEDFSRVLAEVPGCFLALGAMPRGAEPDQVAFNHSPRAVFDDSVLADGAALFTELATRRLSISPEPSHD
ncbi:M20 metallopeptidase family protein [Saccharopolyspora phatthalungensis]|uniref:Hippurate hydrolase n=1 Tax=Saccharopolyspora phatthalungensis TaxID=664693 RepID=A0A840Q455_9PSEU|nr:M20 family metallopeptidase [Saccharopolyspora phatthalungensis]MBB5153518.1 hippurate hydrolase [Saccharopolyspora phatthalungensis]